MTTQEQVDTRCAHPTCEWTGEAPHDGQCPRCASRYLKTNESALVGLGSCGENGRALASTELESMGFALARAALDGLTCERSLTPCRYRSTLTREQWCAPCNTLDLAAALLAKHKTNGALR